jgi:hypothetical protein
VAAKRANPQLTRAQAIEVIRAKLPKRVTREKPFARMTDAEFLAWLQAQECYKGVDIKREIEKCRVWCQGKNGTAPTRMRIINWLNKCTTFTSKPGAGGSGADVEIDIYTEPAPEWRESAERLWPDLLVHNQPWANIRSQYGRRIIQDLRKRAAQ